jgi:hypothetical protein
MVAFQSGLQGSGVGPNDVGIWAGQPGALHLVARTGDGVPAAGQDAQFDFLWPNLMINSSDALLFESTLKGSGISDANDTALFLATPGAAPVMVVREGDGIDVGNGDVRIIRELGTGGGRESYLLNDAGQVAFRATFTDGSSGVFVTVPEPSAAAIAVTGLTLAGLRRQRRR